MDTTTSDNIESLPDDEPEDRMHEPAENNGPAPDHPTTPGELIELVDRMLAEGSDPSEGIQKFCKCAVAEPDEWIEPASAYLSGLITGGRLAECPDIPPAFLVEELAHGATLVSPFIVSHWADTGDSASLVRLADGLIKRAHLMSGADIGAFILYLALDLAIRKPLRSLKLIEIARPLVEHPESDPLVSKATQWQAAGAFLLNDGRWFRKFWQTQLTEGRSISWRKREAIKALAHLKSARMEGKVIPSLFLEAIPSAIWTFADDVDTTDQPIEIAEQLISPSSRETSFSLPAATAAPASLEKEKSGLLLGSLIGVFTVVVAAAWVWRDSFVSTTTPAPIAARQVDAPSPLEITKPDVVAESPPPPQPPQALPVMTPAPVSPVPAAPTVAGVEKTESPPPKPPAPALASAPLVAMIKPVEDSPPPLVPAKPVADTPPGHPNDAWRKAEFAALARQFPSVVRWHTVAKAARWSEVRSLVMGTNGALPYTGDEFAQFLKMLLLDPPLDADVAEAVPKVAARRTQPSEWIPLFEKLVYPGSPNEREVRVAADAYLSAKPDFLMPALLDGLQKLVRPSANLSDK